MCQNVKNGKCKSCFQCWDNDVPLSDEEKVPALFLDYEKTQS